MCKIYVVKKEIFESDTIRVVKGNQVIPCTKLIIFSSEYSGWMVITVIMGQCIKKISDHDQEDNEGSRSLVVGW